MPRLCRNRDLGRTGHSCTAVIGVKATQNTVFANGKPVLRQGDPSLPHTIKNKKKKCVNHPARLNRGSRSVFVQGIPAGRIGDSHDQSVMITGSGNVFAGG